MTLKLLSAVEEFKPYFIDVGITKMKTHEEKILQVEVQLLDTRENLERLFKRIHEIMRMGAHESIEFDLSDPLSDIADDKLFSYTEIKITFFAGLFTFSAYSRKRHNGMILELIPYDYTRP